MLALLADVVVAWSLPQLLIAVILFAAVVAIVYVALNYFGVPVPDVIVKIFWILVVAAVAILGIRFLLSL